MCNSGLCADNLQKGSYNNSPFSLRAIHLTIWAVQLLSHSLGFFFFAFPFQWSPTLWPSLYLSCSLSLSVKWICNKTLYMGCISIAVSWGWNTQHYNRRQLRRKTMMGWRVASCSHGSQSSPKRDAFQVTLCKCALVHVSAQQIDAYHTCKTAKGKWKGQTSRFVTISGIHKAKCEHLSETPILLKTVTVQISAKYISLRTSEKKKKKKRKCN